jgi:hypothetical protein
VHEHPSSLGHRESRGLFTRVYSYLDDLRVHFRDVEYSAFYVITGGVVEVGGSDISGLSYSIPYLT